MTTLRARIPSPWLGAWLLVSSLASTGCASRLPFTHELRTQHDLSSADLEHLQFYVSHDITLRREVRTNDRSIDDGRLRLRAGTQIEEVVIEEGTPGVAVAIGPSAIVVSFDDDSSLVFAIRDGVTSSAQPLQILPEGSFAEPPDPFPGHEPIRTHEPLADAVGKYFLRDAPTIEFRGERWETVGPSAQAFLLIDAETLEDVDEERTTLDGRKL